MVGTDAQTVGHQLFDLLGGSLTVGHRKADIGIGCVDSLYKAFHIFLLRTETPHTGKVGAGLNHRLVVLRKNGLVVPGICRPVGAVGGVDIRPFQIHAGNVFAAGRSHRLTDILSHLDVLLFGHTGIGSRQQGCGAVIQMKLGSGNGMLPKPVVTAGVGMNVHKTGADISALRVQDFAALGNGGIAHFTEAGNGVALDEKYTVLYVVIPHNKIGMDDRKHNSVCPPSLKTHKKSFSIYYHIFQKEDSFF